MAFYGSSFFVSASDQIAKNIVMKRLADVTLSGASATLDTSSFSETDLLEVIVVFGTTSSVSLIQMQLNSDTGGNYGWYFNDKGTTGSGVNDNNIDLHTGTHDEQGQIKFNISNLDSEKHTIQGRITRGELAAAPVVDSSFSSAYNSATSITSIQVKCNGGTFPAGSRIIVLGY